jgi:hypothetical protein
MTALEPAARRPYPSSAIKQRASSKNRPARSGNRGKRDLFPVSSDWRPLDQQRARPNIRQDAQKEGGEKPASDTEFKFILSAAIASVRPCGSEAQNR